MQTPDDLFKGHKAAVLLFLTDSRNEGHWLAVIDQPSQYEVFDSFGTAVDGNRAWLSKKKLLAFDQTAPLLKNLLGRGNKPITHNTSKLQNDNADTCGRWVCLRVLHSDMPLKQFVAKMRSNGCPDLYATKLIYDQYGI
jgi:hypothetical protein